MLRLLRRKFFNFNIIYLYLINLYFHYNSIFNFKLVEYEKKVFDFLETFKVLQFLKLVRNMGASIFYAFIYF